MLGKIFNKPEPDKDHSKDKKPSKDEPLKIDKDTNIGELAMEYPHLAVTLAEDYGLHCIGCFASSFDTLEAGAQIHGMTDEEISEMIERLNKIHQEKTSK